MPKRNKSFPGDKALPPEMMVVIVFVLLELRVTVGT